MARRSQASIRPARGKDSLANILRQKSDAEITRLLRRSFQFGRRKKSSQRKTKPGRWTPEALALLGKVPDIVTIQKVPAGVPANLIG